VADLIYNKNGGGGFKSHPLRQLYQALTSLKTVSKPSANPKTIFQASHLKTLTSPGRAKVIPIRKVGDG